MWCAGPDSVLGTTAMAVRDFLGSGGLSEALEIVASVPDTSATWAGDQPVGFVTALDSGQVQRNCKRAVVVPYG